MSKAVLISIQPKWCELIASGKKTIEVRKTKPKLETPFKCYIYCTQGKGHNDILWCSGVIGKMSDKSNGKVIGEFTCDVIYQYSNANIEGINISEEDMKATSCLTCQELIDYEFSSSPKDFCMYRVGLYGLHISDLVIYAYFITTGIATLWNMARMIGAPKVRAASR